MIGPLGLVGLVIPLDPKAKDMPGTSTVLNLANGIAFWALLAAGLGVIIGSLMWAFGHYSHNFQQSYAGRRGVIVSVLAGLLIGAGPNIIGAFYSMGLGFR